MNRVRRLILVIRHAWAMWQTLSLPKNAAKGDWRQEDVWDLMAKMDQEREELWVACWQFEHGGSAERVEEEAADVSAFAAMVADKVRSLK